VLVIGTFEISEYEYEHEHEHEYEQEHVRDAS
jgi:hypothetical protein